MSRSDHARTPKNFSAAYAVRAIDRDDRREAAAERNRTREHAAAIAEGLDDLPIMHTPVAPYEDALNPYPDLSDADLEEMAAWEYALVTDPDLDVTVIPHEPDIWECDEQTEAEAWAWYDAQPDEPSEWYAGEWLAGTVDDAFPDGGYVIEGPSVREPVRAGAYLRAHEVARMLGLPTKEVLAALRERGEHITNVSAYVALPVVEDLKRTLVVPRSSLDSDLAIQRLRNKLLGHRADYVPARVPALVLPSRRPGSPRPY